MRAFVQLNIDVIFFMFFIYTLFINDFIILHINDLSVLIRQIISGCMRLIYLSTADTFDDDDNEKLFLQKTIIFTAWKREEFVKNKEYYLVF